MTIKVGDKVTCRRDLVDGAYYGDIYFIKSMAFTDVDYVVSVRDTSYGKVCYLQNHCPNYLYSEKMLLPAIDIPKEPFYAGKGILEQIKEVFTCKEPEKIEINIKPKALKFNFNN